jgi:hypothetical protein
VKILDGLFSRLWVARGWIAGQFGGTLLLIVAGLAWTRLPDKHGWQVALSLLIPVLLIISALELEAGTMRKLADDDGKRVKLAWGAMSLLIWIAMAWATWAILDWCDDQFPLWAGYLNSKGSPHARVTYLSFEHITRDLMLLEWIMRWIIAPAKLIPYAVASAHWGWRLPLRRVLRILWNWQWWVAAIIAALLSVWLPSKLFAGLPHGSVSAQLWHVWLKLGAAYVLAVGCWVFLLGWAATLFGRQAPPPDAALVSVPVLAGPPNGSQSAKAEPPIDPDEGPGTEGGPYNRHPKYPPGGVS